MRNMMTQTVQILIDEGSLGDARMEFARCMGEIEGINVETLKTKLMVAMTEAFPGFYVEWVKEMSGQGEVTGVESGDEGEMS
jgi:hypothetical protein